MLDEQTIVDLKSKHPGVPLAWIEGASGTILVFRRPSRDEYERYQDKYTANTAAIRTHIRELALAALVYPDAGALNACMDVEPALLMSDIAPMLHGLAGDGREKPQGKL